MSMMMRSRPHNEKDKTLANALRRESLQLDRTLRFLRIENKRELAWVCGAQSELKRTLGRFDIPQRMTLRPGTSSALVHTTYIPAIIQTKRLLSPLKPCCPNHIVCSMCNLRLRMADTMTRRFTPSLWTMYCDPLSETRSRGSCVYQMPSFVARRNLTVLDKSIRNLPFM